MNGRFIILGWPTQMIFAIDGSADDDVENLPMNRGNQKDTEPQVCWDAEVERFVVLDFVDLLPCFWAMSQ